jgi:hypothetical protein
MNISIRASATGSITPPLDAYPTIVKNGDFDILALSDSAVGDGNNEWTVWTFDFTKDPNFESFADSEAGLMSAKLSLVLKPNNQHVETDSVGIFVPVEATHGISIPLIQDLLEKKLLVGEISVVELELIADFYRPADILKAFNGEPAVEYRNDAFNQVMELLPEERRPQEKGQLLMFYEEDATVCCASLVLSKEGP